MVHEHDHGCGCGHHHDEDTEHLHTNKYQQAFAKFETADTTEEVAERVKTLLGKHGNDNFTPDVLKQIHGFIDLTSLTSIDTKESIWKLVDRVNDFEGTRPDLPNVAAIWYLSPIRGNGKRGPLRTGGKDCIRSRRFPLLADLHGNKDCRNSDGRHAGGR